ncbi:MAG: YXWGXW repeat-containing protein [Bacteroidota bacterium]
MILRIFIFSIFLMLSSVVGAQSTFKIKQAAPKVIVSKPVSPGSKYVWTDGRWKWSKKTNQYIWIDGNWIRKKKGHHWFEGYWEKSNNGWKWIPGRWVKNHKNMSRL